MPGYGDGPGASPFPRSWILPEENDPFIRHVREERLRRGSNHHLLGLYGLSSASPPPPPQHPQHSQHPQHPPHSPGTPLPTYILKPSGGSEGAVKGGKGRSPADRSATARSAAVDSAAAAV